MQRVIFLLLQTVVGRFGVHGRTVPLRAVRVFGAENAVVPILVPNIMESGAVETVPKLASAFSLRSAHSVNIYILA